MKFITPTNIAVFTAAVAIDRFGATLTVAIILVAVAATIVCFEFIRGLYTPNV